MMLIGTPDSPYVRRVAISMKLMGMPFEHQQVSVFRHFDRFSAINPVVKAPSFVCDDGTVLMDSGLILDYVESIAPEGRRLMPTAVEERKQALRLIGLAMAACEKCVQMVYEKQQRPEDKRHQPWFERVTGQAHAAFGELEKDAARAKPWLQGEGPNAADVAVACAWRFGQYYNAVEVPADRYPKLVEYSARAERLPEFASTPLD
jgi:glutathione S-transferase